MLSKYDDLENSALLKLDSFRFDFPIVEYCIGLNEKWRDGAFGMFSFEQAICFLKYIIITF